MSSVEWSPELAAALDRAVPFGDASRADWNDVVARADKRRRPWIVGWQPSRLRVGIVVALVFLLLAGIATATYLIARGNGSLVFQGNDGMSLLVAKPNGEGFHTLASCPVDSGCAIVDQVWSPDGTKIAFLRARYTGHSDRTWLFVAAAGGTDVRRLAKCGYCGVDYGGGPGWSPDGRWIAFSRNWGHQQSLWIVAAAGGNPRRLTNCGTACADVQPTWSPDGRLLVFQRVSSTPGASGLFTVRPGGAQLSRIADKGSYPQWSPDGERIVFDSTPDSIAVADADGAHLRVLFSGARGTGPGAPSWSPDGRKIVFFKTPGRQSHFVAEVWTMNADGTGKKRLYRSGCCVGEWAPPVWSPDGRQIAFSADSAGGTFVINSDGTGLERRSASTSTALAWQRLPKGDHG
jgi:Tol biopolymer transport system component